MKALVKTLPRPGAVDWCDYPDPVATHGEVVIAVEAAGVCGTDVSVYRWPQELVEMYHWETPLVLGHEFTGHIAAIGTGVDGVSVGDRVSASPLLTCGECFFCRCNMGEICDRRRLLGLSLPGAFAEYTKVPASNIIRIADDISMQAAALCEPFAVAVHAMERFALRDGESVAIAGAGPVGLLLGIAAMAYGASQVFITGLKRDRARLAIAAELGMVPVEADICDAPATVRIATERGADLAIDAGGQPETVLQACSLARKAGRVGLIGLPHVKTPISTSHIVADEKQLIGCRAHTLDTWHKVEQLLPKLHEQLARLVSDVRPMAKGSQTLAEPAGPESVKVLLAPVRR